MKLENTFGKYKARLFNTKARLDIHIPQISMSKLFLFKNNKSDIHKQMKDTVQLHYGKKSSVFGA